MNLPIGHILNKNCYQINKVIGQGGFGITYLADEIGYFRNTGFGDSIYVRSKNPDKVVIKELFYKEYCNREKNSGDVSVTNPDRSVEFEKLVQNQLDEGKKLRELNHPNIVRTRDIFKEKNTAYMVMEYVESYDLDVILEKNGKLPVHLAIKYILETLTALSHIHERHQLHLDIKPSNILIRKSNDQAVVIDFGASQSYKESGEIIGKTSQLISAMTRCYAPNEQADIDNLKHFDATFDTYAAGATFYHLLTGQKPPSSSLLSTGREKLTPVSHYVKDLNTDYLDAILLKALAPLYHNRFKTAEDFIRELSKIKDYNIFINQLKSLIADKKIDDAKRLYYESKDSFLSTESLKNIGEVISQYDKKNAKEETVLIIPNVKKDEDTILIDFNNQGENQTNEIQIKENQQTKNKNNVQDQIKKTSFSIAFNTFLIKNKKIVIVVFISLIVVFAAFFIIPKEIKNNNEKQVDKETLVETKQTDSLSDTSNQLQKSSEIKTSEGAVNKTNSAEMIGEQKSPSNSESKQSAVSVEGLIVSEKSVPIKKESEDTKGEIIFNGKKYIGSKSNGIPNGTGTLYYSSIERISQDDVKNTMSEPGDYLKGRWNNGQLEYGTLYDKDGTKKITIVIGRF